MDRTANSPTPLDLSAPEDWDTPTRPAPIGGLAWTRAQAEHERRTRRRWTHDQAWPHLRQRDRGEEIPREAAEYLETLSEAQLEQLRWYGEQALADEVRRRRDIGRYGERAITFYAALGFNYRRPLSSSSTRARAARGSAPIRHRGSRRGSSRSSGGDPDSDSDEPAGGRLHPHLAAFLAAPAAVQGAFMGALAEEVAAECDFDQWHAATESDDPVLPALPSATLPRRAVCWDASWGRRARAAARTPSGQSAAPGGRGDDALATITPPEYFAALAGVDVPADGGMVCCPLHDDHDPWLRVYADPDFGWVCFAGCGGVIAIEGLEPWTDQLDVLLRHGPRSISRRGPRRLPTSED